MVSGPAPQDVWIVSVFTVIVFLFYALFDLLPKMLFRAHPNALCLSAARVFRIINFLLSPLVLLVEDVSQAILHWTGGQVFKGQLFGNREEMRAVMRESGHALTDDEHTMVNRILDLQNYSVGQIAMPLAKMVAVEAQMPLREAVELARQNGFSRLPVWEVRDGKRRVAGIARDWPVVVPGSSGHGETGVSFYDSGDFCERRHPAGGGVAADAARRPARGDRARA